MKILVVMLFILSTSQVFASTLVKTFDGGAARCTEGADIGSRAYRLKIINEETLESFKLITLKVTMLQCAETKKGLQLLPLKLTEVQRRSFLNVTSVFSESKLIAFNEDGLIFGENLLSESGNGDILSQFKIPTSEAQVLLNLNAIESIYSSEGELLVSEPMIAKTFTLNIK